MLKRNGKFARLKKKLSKSDNVCATDLNGINHSIRPGTLPAEVRAGDLINKKYVGVVVLLNTSTGTPYQLKDFTVTQVPDEFSGPFYLPGPDEIIEKKSELPGNEAEEWSPPETNRESEIEWEGTEQNIDSAGAEGRRDVFNSGSNKNDLL